VTHTADLPRIRPGGPPRDHHRLLPAAPTQDLEKHHDLHGKLPWPTDPGALIKAVEAAGLTGRGGAGFPTWRKLAAVRTGSRPVVVANAAETEPASRKDRTLMLAAPHLVLDGLQLAAAAVGAEQAYVYANAESNLAAILDRRRDVTWDHVPVTLLVAPNDFVAGEESAVIAAVEGRPALPRDKPVLVAESGVRGNATLVQNVETLAHLALIARHGPRWFREMGTDEDPGTFLATVSGSVVSPGVHEFPYGVPLGATLHAAGGPTAVVQAVLVGGFHGAWVPPDAAIPITRRALHPYLAAPGCGLVLVLPTDACGLVASSTVADYLAEQSAGQCGPCRIGLPQLAQTLRLLAEGERSTALAARVERLAAVVTGRGACHHPDGTARFALSTLRARAGGRPAPGRRLPGQGWRVSPPRKPPVRAGRPGLGPAGRLHIDWTACDGRGLCAELLPELLDRDEWGYPVPRDGSREPAVPPHLRAHAERAVARCPVLALRLFGG
jgi:NADH:ubiquinone oxidoreductase subunit F (NADH-binding)/ferredoxin